MYLLHHQVFTKDVQNLLSMSDMWKSRAAPVPLEFETIMATPISTADAVLPSDANAGVVHADANSAPASVGLKDQKSLTLKETVELFVSRFVHALQVAWSRV